MPRWEGGSEERLRNAAIELFEEQGFEKTSVIEIAERAGVTTRTFFRYFSDKREVLFAHSHHLRAVLVEKILQAPDIGKPLQLITTVLAEFDWESLGSRKSQRQRQRVIEMNPELLERDLSKTHSISTGLMEALGQRGVNADTARLAAHVGVQLFFTAYRHWLEAPAKTELALMSERLMSLLGSILASNPVPDSVG